MSIQADRLARLHVFEATRAVPAADAVGDDERLAMLMGCCHPALARVITLAGLGRDDEARDAYQAGLGLADNNDERRLIERRLDGLGSSSANSSPRWPAESTPDPPL